MVEHNYKQMFPIYIGERLNLYRVNGRGGRRLLIDADGITCTLEELKILKLAFSGMNCQQINTSRKAVSSKNLRWSLKKRNNNRQLIELYKRAHELELFYPFVLAGFEILLTNSK